MKIKNIAVMIFFVALGLLCLRYASFNSSYASNNFATDGSTVVNIGCTAAHKADTPSQVDLKISVGTGGVGNLTMTQLLGPVLNDSIGQHPTANIYLNDTGGLYWWIFNGLKVQSRSLCIGASPSGVLQAKVSDASSIPLLSYVSNESSELGATTYFTASYQNIKTSGVFETDNVSINWGSNTTNKYSLGGEGIVSIADSGTGGYTQALTFNLGIVY